jgi:hypothetical protein
MATLVTAQPMLPMVRPCRRGRSSSAGLLGISYWVEGHVDLVVMLLGRLCNYTAAVLQLHGRRRAPAKQDADPLSLISPELHAQQDRDLQCHAGWKGPVPPSVPSASACRLFELLRGSHCLRNLRMLRFRVPSFMCFSRFQDPSALEVQPANCPFAAQRAHYRNYRTNGHRRGQSLANTRMDRAFATRPCRTLSERGRRRPNSPLHGCRVQWLDETRYLGCA